MHAYLIPRATQARPVAETARVDVDAAVRRATQAASAALPTPFAGETGVCEGANPCRAQVRFPTDRLESHQ